MDIWGADKLVLFLAFVIPGFISIKCYQLAFPGTERPSSEQLVDAIAYSSINYAILAVPISLVQRSELLQARAFLYYLFYIFVLFLAPVLWVLIWKYVRTRDFFQRNAPHPTAKPWDFVFQQRKSSWVKVTLRNGTIVAGRYAGKSFTSSAPADEQIYLEETWVLGERGQFVRKVSRTSGVLVLSGEISHIEFRE
ncbi:hypothetical protein FKV24_005050 [Lysobacter maris]|uniref:Uncharacterized protein n=1 Tax=Marilutibacter maris TaxID=1605891 RepID=A0A508B331_9GAMM|nr:DUF6338 family protein [Lysobacter maris]KAB8195640.1 hypothetical protein FKV24_005050 [Lysobacter maris]